MGFFSTNIIDITPAGTTGWQTVDISAHVIPSTGMVIVRAFTSGNAKVGARHPSSTTDLRLDSLSVTQSFYLCAGVLTQTVTLFRDSGSQSYYLFGYFAAPEADAIINPVAITPTIGSWQEADLTAYVDPEAEFACFQVHSPFSVTPYVWAARKNGSTDNRVTAGSPPYYSSGLIIPLDANKKCQLYRTHTNIVFYLIGDIKGGTTKTNGLDVSLGSIGSYTDIDVSADCPSESLAAIVEVYANTSTSYQSDLRCNGSSDTYLAAVGMRAFEVVILDSNKKFEGYINNTGVDYYILGYINYWGTLSDVDIELPIPNTDGSGTNDVEETLPFPEILAGTNDVEETLPALQVLSGTNDVDVDLPVPTLLAQHQQRGNFSEITFPVPVMDSWLRVGQTAWVDATLPAMSLESITPPIWTARLTLPSLVVESISEGVVTLWGNITLPVPTMTGTLKSGEIFRVDVRLPKFIIDARMGAEGDLILPLPTIQSTFLAGTLLYGDLTLPAFLVEATSLGALYMSADLVLPRLNLIATNLTGTISSVDAQTRTLGVSSYVNVGEVATVAMTLPVFTMTSGISGAYLCDADIILPMLSLTSILESGLAGNYEVLAFNLRNKSISNYNNYDLDSLTKFGNLFFGSDSNGIWLLSGDKDDTANIVSEIATGKANFGTSVFKRIMDAYVALTGAGSFYLSITTDDGVTKEYPLTVSSALPVTAKTHTARGEKGVYYKAGFKNKAGENFKLDYIELITKLSQRRK